MTNTATVIKEGNKTATIKQGTDGWGDTVYRVTVIQTYFDGMINVDRFIAAKNFDKLTSAQRFAKKTLK